jgi:bifunctional non-homologous end joining protein LigD
MYPEAGFTKGDVIDYYARVASAMVPHVRGRAMSFKRYPDGVEGQSFFNKRCPDHRPEWVHVEVGPGDRQGPIKYCVIDDRPALVWAANLAALELHAPMAYASDLDAPTMVVFDLDPGPPATILDCARVALQIRELFDPVGLQAWPKTSGSKGLQVFVPLNTDVSYEFTKPASRRIAEFLEAQTPEAVVSRMARAARTGRVLVDWSQNTEHKSMVCVYSVRAKRRPTVSTPLRWEEVETALDSADAGMLTFEMGDVLARSDADGDLFAPVLSLRQELRAPVAPAPST